MATSPLRLMPADQPIRLMPGEDQVLADKYATDAAGGTTFGNSFVGALHGADANRAAAEESSLRAAGGPADLYQADNLRQAALEAQARAQAYAAPVGRYEDIHGVGDAGSWLAGAVGQGLGSSVDQMATGGALGIAGGLMSLAPNPLISLAGKGLRTIGAPAAMYKMNAELLKGEAYNTVAKDPAAMQRSAQDINDEVSAHGYRAAVMDTAGQLLPIGRATGMIGKALSKVPMGAKFAGGMALEGATETGQQISQHYAHESLNPNRDTSGDFSELMNSGLGGAAGGGGMNAIGHVGEAALTRLGTQGEGKNGDRISLLGGMKAAESGMSPKDQADRHALMRGDLTAMDMTADDYELASTEFGTKRKAALLEELAKSKLPNAKALIAAVSAVDASDPESAFAPVFEVAAKAVIPKAGLMSPEAFATLGSGKKMKSVQVAGTEIEKEQYATGPSQSKFSERSGKVAPDGTPGVDTSVDPTKLTGTSVEMLPGPLKPLTTDEVTTGERKTSLKPKDSANVNDASTHAARSDYNSKLLWQHFNSDTTETRIPANRSSKDVVDMLGGEIAAMASQGVREAPTPAELKRADVIGRAVATLLGPKAQGVLDTIALRNDVKVSLITRLAESPVFQVMYERATSLHDGKITHETEAVSREERMSELVGMVPTSVAMGLLDDGVDIHSPKVGHYLVNAIEALSQGDDKQRMELNRRFTKPVVDKMVDLMGHGAPIEERDVPVKSVSGKTAATDSDTAGVNESEAEVSGFEKRQAQKSLDKSPPETLVFHHGRGVGPVTKLKDAFNDISTGKLPRLITDGQHNTVPDGKGGKPVESIARLLRNATKTLRGRNGKWALGRNHNLRAASALEVMDSANINDSKREQLMFRYIEQEGGPDVTDLKNMLGVVKSLEAYDRQYSAATIKREKLSPGGGKLSMIEADELVHPGGSQGTLSKLADMAATPEDAALARSTFTKDTATRNTILMGVVRRAKAEALKQLAGTNGFRSFVATTQANESRTPEFKELVNHFFSKRHMVVAEHKSDGDYLKMDLATFNTMAHDGLSLLATASHIGAKAKGGKAFQAAAQIRAEHEMGLLRWYHSDHSPSKPGKGDFDDKSARVVIQAKDLVAWVRAQRNDHTTGKGDGSARGENFGETRKNEDYLRDLTQGIMGLVDQGLVRGMPYIVNGEVHDKTNPTDEVLGWTKEDGSFELYTKKDGTVDLTKVNPGDVAGREEWFEEASMVENTKGLKAAQKAWAKRAVEETLDVVGPMPTEAETVFADGIPPSLDLAGRSYKQMVKARKAGYKLHKQEQEEFEESQSTGNKLRGEKIAQDKHDAEVAGIDYESRKELLDETEMTTAAADRAQAEDVDSTDMQSQEQQDSAEDDTNGFSKFVDEREHIELMTSVLKSAADWALRPLNPHTAFSIEGAGVADGLRKDYFTAGVNQEKMTDAIQRIMSYARSFGRPKNKPKDFGENVTVKGKQDERTPAPNPDIHDDMLLGGHHYIAPLAMLLTPKFMAQVADTRKADMPLFEQLRSFTAKNMLMMMEPDPMSGIPELGGAKLATLISALSGKTDADKQTGEARPDQLKWASQDVSSAGRDAFLQSLIKDSTGKATVRKRARFAGTDYESIVRNYEKSAERISDERIRKAEVRLEVMELKLETLRLTDTSSDEGYALAKKIDALRKNIHDAYARPGLEKLNLDATTPRKEEDKHKASGLSTRSKLVNGVNETTTINREVRRKKPESAQPEVGPATPLGVRQQVNQKQAAEENAGGLGRTTTLAPSLSQETVDLKTEEANGRVDALTKNIGGAVDRLRVKPVVPKNEKPATLNIWHSTDENAELSNLAARPFTFNERDYVSVEHAYQSNKSGKFDQATFDKYKTAGIKRPGTLGTKTAEGWNLRLMKALVTKSFEQNPEAAAKLKATGNAKFTHTQDTGVWAAEFPRILAEVRAELGQAPSSPAEFTNHSGGAVGADSMFDTIGSAHGFTKHNHYWHGRKTPRGNVQLTDAQVNEGILHAKRAADVLKRPWNDKYASLLGRNWFQVKNATQVIAVAPLIQPGEENGGFVSKAQRTTVGGGTGYAVEMAIANGKELHVFDTKSNQWFTWDGKGFAKSATPTLAKNYAGIGSRQDAGVMTKESTQAIKDVFEKAAGKQAAPTDLAAQGHALLAEATRAHSTEAYADQDIDGYNDGTDRLIQDGYESEYDGKGNIIRRTPEQQRERMEAYVMGKVQPDKRKGVRALLDRMNAQGKAHDALAKFKKDNTEALSTHPDAMKNFVAQVKDIASYRKGSNVVSINADLMQQMFDHRGDDAWRDAQIKDKEQRLARYVAEGKKDLKFIPVIQEEVKLLKANDLQGMIDAAEKFVDKEGYSRSIWPAPKLEAAKPKATMRDAIAKKQEYLRNPPDDYTTAKAAEVKAWAEKQMARVREALKGEEDSDRVTDLEDMLSDLKQIVKDAAGAVWSDGELEKSLGPQGVMKNEQAAPVEATTSAPFMPPPTFAEIIKTRTWLRKVLGPDITGMMEDAFPGMTWNGDWDSAKNLMRIATANPIGILTVAHHEAVHALFSKIMTKSPEAKELLERTFGTPQMRKRLAGMLAVKHDGSDASKAKAKALNDLIMGDSAESAEERVAYGFQFYMAGTLTIDTKPRTFFEKVQALMRKVFGAVRDSEKALAILESFDAGKLVEPSAAGVAIQEIMKTGEWRAGFMKRFDKQAQALYNEVMTNESVGLNMGIKLAADMTRMWYTNPARAEKADEPGVINQTQIVTKQFHNRLDIAIEALNGPNAAADLKALGEALNSHTEPAMPHVAKAKRAIQALYKQYHTYAREAGLDLGERFGTKGDGDYHTRVMDLEYLVDHKEEFTAMLMEKYPHVLKSAKAGLVTAEMPTPTEADVANKIHENFINREGVDDDALSVSREDGILNPLFTAGELRKLHWIRDEDIAPFLSTDVVATVTQYLRQGVRAAEYTKRFGRGGELLRDMMARAGDKRPVEGAGGKVRVETYTEDGPMMEALKAKAEADKIPEAKRKEWIDRRMEDLERMNGAMEGSLGKDISPGYRKFQGAVMTMQTLRLLPFMLFSSMMDPNSIRVAGGTNQDMLEAYKRGFGAVWNNWKDMLLGNPLNMREQDGDEMAALEAGAIDNLVRMEQMGTVASSEYSAGITREINHKFFRAIGITYWDRAMRIVAVRAARRSIASMIRGDSKEHSARWLKEVGLKEGQGTVNDEGMLITTRRELAELRMKDEAFVALAEVLAKEEGTSVKAAALNLAAKELEPIHSALNRWVNRAIVSPNAAIRPTRFSDPHFAMFAQFKSFTYAFQETTMRYALREAKHGNMESSARMLTAVPIMIASDMAKAMVMGGGSLPSYMANWTLADWVGHGINRGLSSVPQMGLEIANDPLSLFGPTVSQAGDVLASPFQGDVLKTGLDAVPGLRYARGAIDGALTLREI